MTSPIGQTAITDVTALAQAYDDKVTLLATAQATNAELLVVQGQLNNTIATQQATITEQAAEIAALQPPPPRTVLGASLSANTTAEATRVGSALGVNSFRVYDANKGPASLLTQIMPLANASHQLAASFHLGGLDPVHAFTNGTAAQSVYDAVNKLLTLPIVLIPEHEPDQKNRVPGPDWIALVKKVRAMRDALGEQAQAELWLCLTGTTPARAATWFPGKGVIDGIGWDPYSNGPDVTAVCKPFADAVKALDPALQVGVFEYGPFSTATAALTKTIITSIDPDGLAAAGVTRFYWYDTTVAAGKQISNDPTLAPMFKQIATAT